MVVRDIPIKNIIVGSDRRPIDRAYLEQLKKSIQQQGLGQPIVVTEKMVLVAGHHRLVAKKELGHLTISCNVVPMNELEADLFEIDENVVRKKLTVGQLQQAMVRRKEIYEVLYPETKNGANAREAANCRWNAVSHTGKPHGRRPSFVKDAAAKTNSSTSAICRNIKSGQAFTPEEHDVLDKIRAPILARDLLAERTDRSKVIEQINERGRAALDEVIPREKYTKNQKALENQTENRRSTKSSKKISRPLTELDKAEALIGDDIAVFMRVTKVLLDIQSRRLYTEKWGEFRRYLRERWKINGKEVMTAFKGTDISILRGV